MMTYTGKKVTALAIMACFFASDLFAQDYAPPEMSAQTPVTQASASPSHQQQPSQSLPPTLEQMDSSVLQVSNSEEDDQFEEDLDSLPTVEKENEKRPPTRSEALAALKKISPNLRPFVSVRFEEKIDVWGELKTVTGEIRDGDVEESGLLLPDFEQAKSILSTFPEKDMKPYVSIGFRYGVIFEVDGRQSESWGIMTFDPALQEIQTKITRVNYSPVAADGITENTTYKKIREKIPIDMRFHVLKDQDGDKLTYKAEGLPEGLILTPEGFLRGTAAKPGNYVILVTATDYGGLSSSIKLKLLVEGNNPPEVVQKIEKIDGIEGEFIFLDARKLFIDMDADPLRFAVDSLPAGLRWEKGRIIGILADGIAGEYTTTIIATDITGASVGLPVKFQVKADTGLRSFFLRGIAASRERFHAQLIAQEDLKEMQMTWIEENFLNDFSQISKIPYVAKGISGEGVFPHLPKGAGKDFPASHYIFNCDLFSTCTSIAAQDDYYVYQFKYQVTVTEFVEGSATPKIKEISHALNIVWLGRTNNGRFDIYGIYEPISGKFYNRFVLPASSEYPDEVPEKVFEEYVRSAFLLTNPNSVYALSESMMWVKSTPALDTGNAKFYNPLYTEALFKIYLEPQLADRILEGLKQVQTEDRKPPSP